MNVKDIAIKFFKRDVVTGVAEKPGDEFTANFFGQMTWFKVEEINGESIFAVLR